MDSTLETPVNAQPVNQEQSPAPSAVEEKAQLKALLAEARNTRDMLVNFEAAVQTGTYHGGKMLDLAKGLAFLQAILNQNSSHIDNLQQRLNGGH